MLGSKMIQFLIFTFFYFNYSFAANSSYNVKKLGAKSNGKSDCTEVFLSAWASACATTSPVTIYVPKGRYLLKNAVFSGKSCNNKEITIRMDGTLVAPSDYNVIGNAGNWLKFNRVTGVSILGGTLDGQGKKLWVCKVSGMSCPQGATSLGLYNSNNISINGLSSLNSQMFHIIVYGCHNVNFFNTKISAHGKSPNTDGINIHLSSAVTILNSRIGTGDDCVSIGAGTSNLWIQNISCGPGHGISIGSLGRSLQEEGVRNVTVKTATFIRTQNGVRIKTWASLSNAFVRNVLFQNLDIIDARNPIIIDQHYCPRHQNCPTQDSGVEISDITYEDVYGTSASKVAVKLDCSKTQPCRGIELNGVMLTHNNKPAIASCANAEGNASDGAWPGCFE